MDIKSLLHNGETCYGYDNPKRLNRNSLSDCVMLKKNENRINKEV